MVGLLSGLFNVTVCVVFPIAIFLIILTRSSPFFRDMAAQRCRPADNC